MEPNKHIFVHSSVGVEYFWMDLSGRHVFVTTPSVGVAHIFGGVYVILILKA
jgi:hypothetical protein